jgi:hypothetical protein
VGSSADGRSLIVAAPGVDRGSAHVPSMMDPVHAGPCILPEPSLVDLRVPAAGLVLDLHGPVLAPAPASVRLAPEVGLPAA